MPITPYLPYNDVGGALTFLSKAWDIKKRAARRSGRT